MKRYLLPVILIFSFLFTSCLKKEKINSAPQNKKNHTVTNKTLIEDIDSNSLSYSNQSKPKTIVQKEEKSPLFKCRIISKEGLRVRKKADLDSEKIGLLEYNSQVDIYTTLDYYNKSNHKDDISEYIKNKLMGN